MAHKLKKLRLRLRGRVAERDQKWAICATKIQLMLRRHNARERFRALVEARGAQREGSELYQLAKQKRQAAERAKEREVAADGAS